MNETVKIFYILLFPFLIIVKTTDWLYWELCAGYLYFFYTHVCIASLASVDNIEYSEQKLINNKHTEKNIRHCSQI